jgi:hypothetical protein
MRHTFCSGAWCGLLLFALALAGCEDGQTKTYPVKGKVTLSDGSPLANARVIFDGGEAGVKAEGRTGADGSYTITTYADGDGAVAGAHRVIVMGPPRMIEAEGGEGGEGEGSVQEDPSVAKIHSKYQTYANSGLSFTVATTGENVYDITVEREQ